MLENKGSSLNFADFETRDWAIVTAKISVENSKLYGRTGPVLYVKALEKAALPETEVATFY